MPSSEYIPHKRVVQTLYLTHHNWLNTWLRSRLGSALTLPTTDIKAFALGSMEGYNATHSQIATKTSTALLETVSVVTRKQMDDQGQLADTGA